MRKVFVMLALACVIAGCGQKGPLYLPETVPSGIEPATTDAADPDDETDATRTDERRQP